MGPLTTMMMPGELVAAEASWMQLGSYSNSARIVAKTTGKYSGKQPAITALAAACSAVKRAAAHWHLPQTQSPGAEPDVLQHRRHLLNSRRRHRQPIGPPQPVAFLDGVQATLKLVDRGAVLGCHKTLRPLRALW